MELCGMRCIVECLVFREGDYLTTIIVNWDVNYRQLFYNKNTG